MKCTNCGTELTEGAAFCPECGSPVNNRQQEPEATAETKQETVANEPAEAVTKKVESAQAEDAAAEAATDEETKSDAGEEVPVTEETPTETAEVPTETVPAADGEIPAIEETPKKKPLYKKPLFYIILVLILALLAGGGYFLAKEVIFRDEDDVAKAWKNTLNAEFENNEIYKNLKDFDEDKGLTYELFANLGSELTTLPSDIALQLNADIVKDKCGKVELFVGSSKDGNMDSDNEKLLTVSAFTDTKSMAFGSNLLGDKLYGITVDENIQKNFENSYIGQLIMSQLGDIFGDASLNLEPKNDNENIYEAFLKTIKETRKTEKEKIEIDGKTVSVTANIYTVKATDAAKLVQDILGSVTYVPGMTDDFSDIEGDDLTVKIYVKGKYVVRIDLIDKEETVMITFGKDPKKGNITVSFTDKDGKTKVVIERTVANSADEYVATYKTPDEGSSEELNIAGTFVVEELKYTHNKKDGKIKVEAKTSGLGVSFEGTIKTDNGVEVEFKNIANYGVDIRFAIKNKSTAGNVPEFTDILKLTETDFTTTIAADIQENVQKIIEKVPDVLGEDFAKYLEENLSDIIPGLGEEDTEYYTSGNYAYFEQSTHPNGLSQEYLQGIYEQCVSVITGGNATAGVKDYSDYLGCYVAVFEQKIGDVTYHIEKCYADDTYSEIGAYFCRVFDKNGCAIDIYLDNLKICEGIYVYLAENADSAIILIYDGTGAFQTVYTNDEQ